MTRARCAGCGHSFEPRKPPDERESPLRCGECNSRDVELIDEDSEPVAARAFRRFRDGDGPLELVEDGLCDPAGARQLRDEFNDLAEGDVVLLSEADLAERVESARAEVREAERERAKKRVRAARREEHQRAQQEAANVQRQARREGWRAGHAAGHAAAEEELRDELEATLEERVRELQKDHRERLKVVRREAVETVAAAEEAIADREETIERLSGRIEELQASIEAMESGDEGKIWADGYASGVRAGAAEAAKEGHDAGRLDGMKAVIQTMRG